MEMVAAMKMKTRPHGRTPPADLVQRAALRRERGRREQEATMIAVACRVCGQELAAVLPGADCWCRSCHTWTSSLPSPKRGVVGDG